MRRAHSEQTAVLVSTSVLLCKIMCRYPLADDPEGILKVFCRLNFPVVTESAD